MSRRFTYTQYLQRIQRRGSPNCKQSFCKNLKARHLWDESVAIALVAAAVIAFTFGLHIGALMCALLAIPVIIIDLWCKYQERKQGF